MLFNPTLARDPRIDPNICFKEKWFRLELLGLGNFRLFLREFFSMKFSNLAEDGF